MKMFFIYSVIIIIAAACKEQKGGELKGVTGDRTEMIASELQPGNSSATAEMKPDRKITLDDIKTRYGSVYKIQVKGGKVYEGAYKQKDGQTEIITVEGRFTVPSDSVLKTSPYK